MRPEQIIISHQSTDFDALGSMLAARRLYPQAVIVLHGGANRNVREFLALHAAELELQDAARCDLGGVQRAIVIETSRLERLGDLAEVVQRPDVEGVLFDHHGGERPDWVAEGQMVSSEDGALCTTMVGILGERGLEPTPTEATALALGIHEDTGSLTFPSTTLRDVEALAFCAHHGASQELISRFLHTPLGEEQRAMLTTLVDGAETIEVEGVRVLVSGVRWPRYVDGISELASKIVDLTECDALVMLVEMDERVLTVARSRTSALDVGRVLEPLGGGGHAGAASAIVRGGLVSVRAQVAAALAGGVTASARARDVMSAPVWFVDQGTSIDEALAECRRRKTSGVQVTGDGMLVGTVAREDLGRAVVHGLGHAPVRGVMSANAEAVTPDASLDEMQRTLVRAGGRVAVTKQGGPGPHPVDEVVGVVTRGDLLRALRHRVEPELPGPAAADLAERLLALPGMGPLWDAVQAASQGEQVYLVGGAVRDVLLGERTFDIDLAVEGDGIAFGAALARALGGRVHSHVKFRTAVVIAGDQRVDVASARTEHYEYPAALPVVERSTIGQDLHRRDFTINAMAVALGEGRFGELVDPYGGERDLRAGRIRVLHNLSFIEDPTRIFRAIRYENRYRFEMDAHTRELARACVEMGLVGDLSGARVRDELLAILSESEIGAALARLDRLGMAAAVHPRLDCGPDAVALVGVLDEARARLQPDAPAWRLRLAAIARHIPGDDLAAWLEALRIRRRDARVVGEIAVVGPRLAGPLAEAAEPARIAELLDAHPPEVAVWLAAAGGNAGDAAEHYLLALRAVRLEVDGATLRAELGLPESPELGRLLGELLRRKRNGELDGREQELAVARELAGLEAGA